MNPFDNREEGAAFELLFKKHAQLLGYLPIKNHLSAQYIGGGGVRAFKSDLDFRLIDRQGRVAFVDCKHFDKEYFTFSDINAAQLDKAVLYNDWNIPAGFLVGFRQSRQVYFYTGKLIAAADKGERFTPTEGICCGFFERMNLKPIMELYGHVAEAPTLKPG